MANTNGVILPAHYVGVDTSAGPVTYNPDPVEFKLYRIVNEGSSGNDVTVSQTGLTTKVLEDGETGEFIYANGSWVEDPRETFGDITVDSLALTSGRKAISEYPATTVSDGWNVVAQTAAGGCGLNGVLVVTAANNDTMRIKFALRASSGAKTLDTCPIEIENISSFSAGTSDFLGARTAKSDSNIAAGFKIEVLTSGAGSISSYLEQTGQGNPLELIEPTLVDNDKTPDGVAASFLVAGESYTLTGFSVNGFDPRVSIRVSDANNATFFVKWQDVPLLSPTSMTFTPAGAIVFDQQTGVTYNITGGENYGSIAVDQRARLVTFNMNGAGLFTGMAAGYRQELFTPTAGLEIKLS